MSTECSTNDSNEKVQEHFKSTSSIRVHVVRIVRFLYLIINFHLERWIYSPGKQET